MEKEIAEKMVEGRMKKFTGEISLTGQQFVKDPSITVADLLKQKGADVGIGTEKIYETCSSWCVYFKTRISETAYET